MAHESEPPDPATVRTAAAPGRGTAVRQLLDPERNALVLGEELGRGGMAVVHTAQQVAMRRTVAVKSARLEELRDGLVQEAWCTGALEHPNIVPVYDIPVIDGIPHVVMKRIEGEPWSSLLRQPDRVRTLFGAQDLLEWHLRVFLQVCRAVEYAHDKGILHRDIKPANVMIGTYGEVYVLDWGLAVGLRGDHGPRVPRAGDITEISGTPNYMAPEMLHPKVVLTEQTDVYLLGGVLHRIVTGKPPRSARSIVQVLASSERPIRVDVGLPLCSVVERALALDPHERPSAVRELRGEVEAFLARRGTAAISVAAGERLETLLHLLPQADEGDRQKIYDLFGACCFGFEEVLRAAPDDEDARAGLAAAVTELARWELVHGDDRSASVHLARLDTPPPDLLEELSRVRAERQEAAGDLERLRRDRDTRSGWPFRVGVGVAMVVVWVAPPVLTGVFQVENGYPRQAITSVGTALGTMALLPAFWRWLRHTRYNRVLVAACAMSPVLAGVCLLAAWLAGVPGETASALRVVAFVSASMFVTALADWRFFPSVLGYVAALLVGSRWPDVAEAILGCANVLIVLNGFAIWLPAMWSRRQNP